MVRMSSWRAGSGDGDAGARGEGVADGAVGPADGADGPHAARKARRATMAAVAGIITLGVGRITPPV
jgi:hypothetical protein